MVSDRIVTVTDVPGQGARTPEEYRAIHARRVAQRRQIPGLQSLQAYETDRPIAAYVTKGVWRTRCVCGEAPSTHPAWALACCAGCGAIHTAVVFPPEDIRAAIETVLLKRPRVSDRNWTPPWTPDDLTAQNLAHGDPV